MQYRLQESSGSGRLTHPRLAVAIHPRPCATSMTYTSAVFRSRSHTRNDLSLQVVVGEVIGLLGICKTMVDLYAGRTVMAGQELIVDS
jgi:hypothetical protein